MKRAAFYLDADELSLFLAKYLLALAVFFSPISVLLRFVMPLGVAAALVEINLILAVLLLFAVYTIANRPYKLRVTLIDLAMFVWLAYGLIALLTAESKSTSIVQSVGVMRYMFAAPIWYFFFRIAIKKTSDFRKMSDFSYALLKAVIIYILIEFVVAAVFDYWREIEAFVLKVRPDTAGIYFHVFSLWPRPAGPIFGQQNASILCDVALVAFYLRYRERRGWQYIFWILASAVALVTTITITALLVLFTIVLAANLKRFISSASRAAFAAGILMVLVLMFVFRAEIISLRVAGLEGTDYLQQYESVFGDSVKIFAAAFTEHPFGLGWDVPIDFNLDSKELFIPTEIFLLRMSYYLGSVFFVYFVLFHLYLLSSYLLMRGSRSKELVPLFAYGVIFTLLLSTMHYESFTNTGFPQLYALAVALLACFAAEARTLRSVEDASGAIADSEKSVRLPRNAGAM